MIRKIAKPPLPVKYVEYLHPQRGGLHHCQYHGQLPNPNEAVQAWKALIS